MKWQLCKYQEREGDVWSKGIAKVESVNCYNVEFIITAEGRKLPSVWRYHLYDGLGTVIVEGIEGQNVV